MPRNKRDPRSLHRFRAMAAFYPTLGWNYLLGRVLKLRRWWDRIDDNLIVGARPLAGDPQLLFDEGVRAVVNTCEEYDGPVALYRSLGIDQLHIPTTDFTHPSLADIQAAVEFIDRHARRGETVYVHCKAGRARSATVALCWLIQHRGLDARQAQARLLQFRPHVNRRLVDRPVVREFIASLRQSDDSAGDG